MTIRRRPVLIPRYRGVILPAVGPCMILAPVVFLAVIVGMICWPFVVVAAVPLWGLSWLLERSLVSIGVTGASGLFRRATRVMRLVAKPWTYYDAPDRPGNGDAGAAMPQDATSDATTTQSPLKP